MQKVKVKGQSVQKIKNTETDGQTDGRRRLHYLKLANEVGTYRPPIILCTAAWPNDVIIITVIINN